MREVRAVAAPVGYAGRYKGSVEINGYNPVLVTHGFGATMHAVPGTDAYAAFGLRFGGRVDLISWEIDCQTYTTVVPNLAPPRFIFRVGDRRDEFPDAGDRIPQWMNSRSLILSGTPQDLKVSPVFPAETIIRVTDPLAGEDVLVTVPSVFTPLDTGREFMLVRLPASAVADYRLPCPAAIMRVSVSPGAGAVTIRAEAAY